MKSHQANPAELAALSAVPNAPFPLTPSAQALKDARQAALRRKALEEEDEKAVVSDSVAPENVEEAMAADGITAGGADAEGAALEAIAPAPLPADMSGMEMLLAQAGPAATGGATAAGGVPIGLVVGGAVVVVAAAASGGSSSSTPAPSPAPAPAPPAPPNKPATIETSEIQRTGKVHEDADGEYEFTTIGNNAITALKVVDADGGADLSFRAATAEELQGTYGMFSFDATSGIWSYTLDNEDPDTQGLMGNAYAYDYLTVYSADGTASTVIEVTVDGKLDWTQETVTVNQGDTVLIDMSVDEQSYFERMEYDLDYVTGHSSYTHFETGGFMLYTAGEFNNGQIQFYPTGYTDSPLNDVEGNGYVPITISMDGADGSAPVIDGTFHATLTEGTAGAVNFSGALVDADEDGGIYTLVLAVDLNNGDGYFDYIGDDPTFFTLGESAGITMVGNGTHQVALQGTLAALNDYLDDGEAMLTLGSEQSADESILAWLVDDNGNMVSTSFYSSFTSTNDSAPVIEVYLDESGIPNANPNLYVPAAGTPYTETSFNLDDFNGFIRLHDEESAGDYYNERVELTISVVNGTLSLHNDAFWDYDSLEILIGDEWVDDESGMFSEAYTNVQQITIGSYYSYGLEDALEEFTYYVPESFDVGASDTLNITLTDSQDQSATVAISLIASAQDQAPFFSFSTDSDFMGFTVLENDMSEGPTYMDGESYATAQFHEDQHVSFEGIAINDPDAAGSDKFYVSFYAYQYQFIGANTYDGIDSDSGEIGVFYVDDAYRYLMVSEDFGIGFYGSADEINEMFAAGGLHYIPPPDYDAVSAEGEYSLGIEMMVEDLGNGGYGNGSATLYIGIDMIATEDPVFILDSPMQWAYETSETVTLYEYNMLSSDYVFDAEYNGNGDGGELMVTNVTIQGTTGTGTLDESEDGNWIYTLGEGDVAGDEVIFNYTISDGTSTFMNTLELSILAQMDA